MLPRPLTLRRLAAAAAVAAAALTLAASPASAATGPGASASVSTRVDDPGDVLRRAGNVHMVNLTVDNNPEGAFVEGDVTSWDCEPGQTFGDCDRIAAHRLVLAGPVSVSVSGDGSARVTASVAEVRIRDGRQLRVFDVDLAVTAGNLTARLNTGGGFVAPDGTFYNQAYFLKQWTSSTASGTIGVFEVVPGASSPASTRKYWVQSSVPLPV